MNYTLEDQNFLYRIDLSLPSSRLTGKTMAEKEEGIDDWKVCAEESRPMSRKRADQRDQNSDNTSNRSVANEAPSQGNPGKEKRKRVKAIVMPRRPLSAYNMFFREQRELIIEERTKQLPAPEPKKRTRHPATKRKAKISFEELAKLIGARWKIIDPVEKQRLQSLAEADANRYKAEMKIYQKACADLENSDEDDNDEEDEEERKLPAITINEWDSVTSSYSPLRREAESSLETAVFVNQYNHGGGLWAREFRSGSSTPKSPSPLLSNSVAPIMLDRAELIPSASHSNNNRTIGNSSSTSTRLCVNNTLGKKQPDHELVQEQITLQQQTHNYLSWSNTLGKEQLQPQQQQQQQQQQQLTMRQQGIALHNMYSSNMGGNIQDEQFSFFHSAKGQPEKDLDMVDSFRITHENPLGRGSTYISTTTLEEDNVFGVDRFHSSQPSRNLNNRNVFGMAGSPATTPLIPSGDYHGTNIPSFGGSSVVGSRTKSARDSSESPAAALASEMNGVIQENSNQSSNNHSSIPSNDNIHNQMFSDLSWLEPCPIAPGVGEHLQQLRQQQDQEHLYNQQPGQSVAMSQQDQINQQQQTFAFSQLGQNQFNYFPSYDPFGQGSFDESGK